MLIYLLRHGLTEYNAQKRYQGQRDIPLSAEGLSQLRRADIDPKVADGPDGPGALPGGRARGRERTAGDVLRQLRGQKLR